LVILNVMKGQVAYPGGGGWGSRGYSHPQAKAALY
jgi:hypothetical protein